MNRYRLYTNNYEKEFSALIEEYREYVQKEYERLIGEAEEHEQSGDLDIAESYRRHAMKQKEILDNPSLLFHEVKQKLMWLQKRPSRKDNSPLSFNQRHLSPRTHAGWVRPQNRIRVPKLKRKTAWKRFYKIFPHLKGEDKLGKGDSLIKLKRYEFVPQGKRKRKKK